MVELSRASQHPRFQEETELRLRTRKEVGGESTRRRLVESCHGSEGCLTRTEETDCNKYNEFGCFWSDEDYHNQEMERRRVLEEVQLRLRTRKEVGEERVRRRLIESCHGSAGCNAINPHTEPNCIAHAIFGCIWGECEAFIAGGARTGKDYRPK